MKAGSIFVTLLFCRKRTGDTGHGYVVSAANGHSSVWRIRRPRRITVIACGAAFRDIGLRRAPLLLHGAPFSLRGRTAHTRFASWIAPARFLSLFAVAALLLRLAPPAPSMVKWANQARDRGEIGRHHRDGCSGRQ
jgi:hypothetical protein